MYVGLFLIINFRIKLEGWIVKKELTVVIEEHHAYRQVRIFLIYVHVHKKRSQIM